MNHLSSIRGFFYLPRNAVSSHFDVRGQFGATASPYLTLYFTALGAQPFTVGLLR